MEKKVLSLNAGEKIQFKKLSRKTKMRASQGRKLSPINSKDMRRYIFKQADFFHKIKIIISRTKEYFSGLYKRFCFVVFNKK